MTHYLTKLLNDQNYSASESEEHFKSWFLSEIVENFAQFKQSNVFLNLPYNPDESLRIVGGKVFSSKAEIYQYFIKQRFMSKFVQVLSENDGNISVHFSTNSFASTYIVGSTNGKITSVLKEFINRNEERKKYPELNGFLSKRHKIGTGVAS